MENKTNTRLCGMLGFAMRAGKVIIGTELVCSSMAKKSKDAPRLILISSTASDGTTKKILTKSDFYGIDAVKIDLDSDELGHLLGKLYAPAVVAITDDRFAEEIRRAVSVEVPKDVSDSK